MESQFSLLFLIFFLFFLSFLWVSKRHHKQKNKAKILLPGPWKLPVLGNLHQLLLSGSSLLHHTLRELSLKYGPLMQLQLGEISTVIVSSPEVAKEVMKTHDLAFAYRPEILSVNTVGYGEGSISFAPYGEYWRQMRKICTLELLSVKRVKSFSNVREHEVEKLIKSIQSSTSSEIDLTSKIHSLTSAIVTKVAFGESSTDHEKLVQLLGAAFTISSGGFNFVDIFPSMKYIHFISGKEVEMEKLHKKIDEMLEGILKHNRERKMKAEGDEGGSEVENLVEVLLRIQQSGSLEITISDDNIKGVIWDIFGGGTDTSATTIVWAMSEMIRNQKVMEKAQAEIRQAFKGMKAIHDDDMGKLSYLKSVIKETLRLHPPVPLLAPRECREACKINGYEIPIKTRVVVNVWAMGRDPKHWYEADRFMPERFHGNSDIDFKGTNFEYIPFGAGRRICPGISFGLASVEFPLACLLYYFDWKLPNEMKPEDFDMTEAFGSTVGRKNNLYLIPTPYNYPSHDSSY